MKLPDKIINLRKDNGWSQEELAEKLNVSRQAVSRWESGSAPPDAANLLQLSRLFSVTTDYLLNDEYEKDDDLPKGKVSVTVGMQMQPTTEPKCFKKGSIRFRHGWELIFQLDW